MKRNYAIAIFLVGVVVGTLCANILFFSQSNDVYAQTAGASKSGEMIAVTGLCSNSYAGLWVIDTRDTKFSPSLALYIPEGGGRSGIRLAAVRRIKWDLKLVRYYDRTRGKDLHPSRMQRRLEQMNKEEEKKAK